MLCLDRHDEEFEKEIDAIRTEIARGHRYISFDWIGILLVVSGGS